MSENRNLPLMLSILGIVLIVMGIGLGTVQPFVGLGVVLALFGLIVLLVAFVKMRPKSPIRWRMRKPQIGQ